MKRTIKITVANPAGNKTIFVHDRLERAEYAKVAEQLLGLKEYAAEQVAFILEAPECGRAHGKMEMCGLEFCGNATRTFGLMIAKKMGISGAGKVFIDTSGADEILTVEVNTETNYTKVKMPAYIGIKRFDLSGIFGGAEIPSRKEVPPRNEVHARKEVPAGGEAPARRGCEGQDTHTSIALKNIKAVDFGGILHLIIPDVHADIENFEKVKNFVYDRLNPPAVGAMFYDTEKKTLTPVVYVQGVDSTYFEGSCASGTAACAVAFSAENPDGEYGFTFPQPAGTINASAVVRGGKVQEVYIEGPVEISEPVTVEIEM